MMLDLSNGTVEQCNGCAHIATYAGVCLVLVHPRGPSAMWRRGDCPYATHLGKVKRVDDNSKVRVGQQKQKKNKRGK